MGQLALYIDNWHQLAYGAVIDHCLIFVSPFMGLHIEHETVV